ncbi:MAG: hypothetical protein RL477_392 [Pseudomonadota bacterium]|jgi:hypothetical protein
MTPQTEQSSDVAIRTRMKGAIVKVLEKAKRDKKTDLVKRFPRAGGYVTLAQSGLRRMFGADGASNDRPRLSVVEPAPSDRGIDAVHLAALAINAIGPASFRAAVFGTQVTIKVDDEATARALRAAVELSSRERPTNALIHVEAK